VPEKQLRRSEEDMKKATSKPHKAVKEMRAEYDFSKGVRGKHAQALQRGYTIEIHQPDGTTVIDQVRPTEGVVILDPDIREYFPDSRSVNDALRALVKLIPTRKPAASRKGSG
jgi:hypothetical protein